MRLRHIESDEDGQQNITIKDPSKSFWDVLGLLGCPISSVVLAWFQRTQQEQSERIAKEQREKHMGTKPEKKFYSFTLTAYRRF